MAVTQREDTSLPNYVRPEVSEAEKDLQLIDDLLAGTRRMWSQAQARGYIRKWKDEKDDVYRIRSQSEVLYDGLGRTLSAAVGMLFAKPPKLEWNTSEGRVRPQWDDIDGAGEAGHVFIKRFSDRALRDGVAVLLVDHTPAPVDPETREPIVVTADNERRYGLRPTWTSYPRTSAVSWHVEKMNGRTVLTQLVLYEPTMVRDGEFGVSTAHRFRVLKMVGGQATWRLVELVKGQDGADAFANRGGGVFRNQAGEPAPFLPVSVCYTGRKTADLVAEPPLLGVAWMNLSHWRSDTNLEFYRQLACFPQPKVTGDLAQEMGPQGVPVAGKIRLGPLVAVHLAEGGDFDWAELQGTSLERIEQAVKDKERRMGQLGMSFLAPDHRQQETAEAKRLDATAENASLATSAQGIDDAVNLAFQHHAWYMGIAKEQAPVFTLNRDFENTAMDAETMRAYVVAVKEAGLPPRLLLEAWQQGGRIGPDEDLDRLELEMLAGDMANRDREREDRDVFGLDDRMTA